jgi:ATP-dependent Lon protease
VGYWDTVAFDEVAGIKIKDRDSVQIMKDYMANGRFSRGAEVIANAGLAFVGNIDYSIEQLVNSAQFDLFITLPPMFDLAIMDRYYTYLPGWEIPKISSEYLTNSYGLITDYIAEAFHYLFKHSNRYDYVNKHCKLGKAVQGRDENAVKKTVCAFLKILHPKSDPAPEELDEYIHYAIEGRRRVKEQMNKRKPDDEFAAINLSYFNHAGVEIIVYCPESKNAEATQNPKRAVLPGVRLRSADEEQKIKEEDASSKQDKEELSVVTETEKTETSPTPELPTELKEKHFKIHYGAVGYSYESIFGDYLAGAKNVTVEDPYIRYPHQIQNFLRFCELVTKIGTAETINLVTGFDDKKQKEEAESKLQVIAYSLKDHGITLSIKLNQQMHDREIRLDDGWKIKIGRGLDIYQKPDDWFNIGSHDLDLRPCLETMVDIFRDKVSGER